MMRELHWGKKGRVARHQKHTSSSEQPTHGHNVDKTSLSGMKILCSLILGLGGGYRLGYGVVLTNHSFDDI